MPEQEPPEALTEISQRMDGLAEQIRRMEAADKRKKTPPPPVEAQRTLYRVSAIVLVVALVLMGVLTGLHLVLDSGVLGH